MKMLLVIAGLLICGCAMNAERTISGVQTKNGGPIRFERMGTITTEDMQDRRQCGMNQVSWCSGNNNCQCLFIHEAENRARQMARRHAGGPGI